MKYKCLSIAGFDSSGGAGLQADLKTFSATGSYGMTVLTAIPVQNTCGVKSCYHVDPQCVKEQLDVIFEDIQPDAIKVGMLFTEEIITLVANYLKRHASKIPLVIDPVMVAKSGDRLLQENALLALKTQLLPMASVVTPNLPEAQCLFPEEKTKEGLAEKVLGLGCYSVLLKGGHEKSKKSEDVFLSNEQRQMLSSKRINSKNKHGTGCTLAAAIASFLAQGKSPLTACRMAKEYLYGAIVSSQYESVGKGNGPVHHFYQLWEYLACK